jgi:hypothetical protein
MTFRDICRDVLTDFNAAPPHEDSDVNPGDCVAVLGLDDCNKIDDVLGPANHEAFSNAAPAQADDRIRLVRRDTDPFLQDANDPFGRGSHEGDPDGIFGGAVFQERFDDALRGGAKDLNSSLARNDLRVDRGHSCFTRDDSDDALGYDKYERDPHVQQARGDSNVLQGYSDVMPYRGLDATWENFDVRRDVVHVHDDFQARADSDIIQNNSAVTRTPNESGLRCDPQDSGALINEPEAAAPPTGDGEKSTRDPNDVIALLQRQIDLNERYFAKNKMEGSLVGKHAVRKS